MNNNYIKLIKLIYWVIIINLIFGIGLSLAQTEESPPPPPPPTIIQGGTIKLLPKLKPKLGESSPQQKPPVKYPIVGEKKEERERSSPIGASEIKREKRSFEIERRGEKVEGELTGEEFNAGIEFTPPKPHQKITLNINDVDLPELVRFISLQTGKRFIIGGKVRSIKATIFAPTKVTIEEAYRAFLAVLQANGLTVVPVAGGKYYEIVPSEEGGKRNIPTYFPGEKGVVEERMITRLHRLNYVSAEQIASLLENFRSNEGSIITYLPTNTLIITDFATNIARMLRIVEYLDVPGGKTHIWIEPIYYADATELADLLTKIFEIKGGELSQGGPPSPQKVARSGKVTVGSSGQELLRIIPDPRTNSLIIIASEKAYLTIIELVKKLDIPIVGGGDLHVIPLQHADAEKLSQTLSSVVTGRRGGTKASKSGEAGVALEGEVKISADKATNSLIIIATARDFSSLKSVIDQLDRPRKQVFVEAVIMEVSLETQRRLGLAFHLGYPVTTSKGDAILVGGTAFDSGQLQSIILDPTTLMGMAVGLRGPDIPGTEDIFIPGKSIPSFGVILQALQTSNDVNILSTPHILATDNEEAEITVGGNVPVQQGFTASLAGLTGKGQTYTGFAPLVSVGRQNVGLTLKITPHINESDQVKLEIQAEVSEVTGETSLGPIISQRTAKTTSIVKDQETVVLGGLITDNVTESTEKVPILGDIPIIGYLFKRKTKRVTKRNLLIFLTPYIVRDSRDFRRLFQRKLEERQEFIERFTAFQAKRLEPYIDYSKTNGIIEEINKTIKELQEKEELQKQLEKKELLEHVAKEPINLPPELETGGESQEKEGEGREGEPSPTIQTQPLTTPIIRPNPPIKITTGIPEGE